MRKNDDETFLVTNRKVMDVIEVYDEQGNKILEVAILETRKGDVKLGFRGSKALRYCLLRALEDGIH